MSNTRDIYETPCHRCRRPSDLLLRRTADYGHELCDDCGAKCVVCREWIDRTDMTDGCCSAMCLQALAKARQHPTLRWWEWVNDGWVRLSLRPGQSLWWSGGGLCDEGHLWIDMRWAYLYGHIFSAIDTDARDCDGRHSTHGVWEWDGMATRECSAPGVAPEWERLTSSQRYYTAEAMGCA